MSENEVFFRERLEKCRVKYDFTTNDKLEEKKEKLNALEEIANIVKTKSISDYIDPKKNNLLTDLINLIFDQIIEEIPSTYVESFENPSWPHYQVLYEILENIVNNQVISGSDLKKSLTVEQVNSFISMFNSADSRQRDFQKIILHKFYAKLMNYRTNIRGFIIGFLKRAIDGERLHGVGELLEIMGSIINGFAVPLKEEHTRAFKETFVLLYYAINVDDFSPQLSYCISEYLSKDQKLAHILLKALIKCWDGKNLYNGFYIQGLFLILEPKYFTGCEEQFFQIVQAGIISHDPDISRESVSLFNSFGGVLYWDELFNSNKFKKMAIDFFFEPLNEFLADKRGDELRTTIAQQAITAYVASEPNVRETVKPRPPPPSAEFFKKLDIKPSPITDPKPSIAVPESKPMEGPPAPSKDPKPAATVPETIPKKNSAVANDSKAEVKPSESPSLLSGWQEGQATRWNRGKIMIVGAGRAGKTALTRSLIGEQFKEDLESTIGINEFSCNVEEVGSKQEKGSAAWNKCEESTKLLEGAVARVIQSKLNSTEEEKNVRSNQNSKESKAIPLPETINLTSSRTTLASMSQADPKKKRKEFLPTLFQDLKESNEEGLDEDGNTYDQHDYDKKVTNSDVNQEEVIKCLAENKTLLNSQFIISIYDYGGQSIFNAIHPFFLSKNGIYIIAFDMRQLSSKATNQEKEKALENIQFWFNSIALHAYDVIRRDMAPILFVGSRKDIVFEPKEHEEISKLLSFKFKNHTAWPFVITNQHGQGSKGNTNFAFYPIDNKKGRNGDKTIMELIISIEKALTESFYMNKEVPLIWLKVIDKMKELSKDNPCLTYQEVVNMAKECNVSDKSIPFLLKFMKEMGFSVWHEEASLRDIIILDPVKYFVTPATVIICKHQPNHQHDNNNDHTDVDADDTTWHLLPEHDYCRKRYPDDWRMMLQYGFVSEELIHGLLANSFPQYRRVIQLMEKYGLLFRFDDIRKNGVTIPGYIVPSLFPVHSVINLKEALLANSSISKTTTNVNGGGRYSFAFGFYVSSFMEEIELITISSLQSEGFLPNGFYDRFLSRIISACMIDSPFQASDWKKTISKETILLNYKDCKIHIVYQLRNNLIQIDCYGPNPLPIYLLMMKEIHILCEECYETLKVMTLLPYYQPSDNASTDTDHPQWIKLSSLENCLQNNQDLSLSMHSKLSLQEMKKIYNIWLYLFKQSLPLTNYDIFLSYRWNPVDSAIVNGLFHDFFHFNLSSSFYLPVSVFLDHHRLQDGEDFRDSFLSALLSSKVIVPIITYEALKRMLFHDDPNIVDNLLLEWIVMILIHELKQEQSQHAQSNRIHPIVYGDCQYNLRTNEILSISSFPFVKNVTITNPNNGIVEIIPSNQLLSILSEKPIPKKTIEIVEQLFQKRQLPYKQDLSKLSIGTIIKKLLNFNSKNFIQENSFPNNSFPLKLSQITNEFSKNIISLISKETSLYTKESFYSILETMTIDDQYFYNFSPPTTDSVVIPRKNQEPPQQRPPESSSGPPVLNRDAGPSDIVEISTEELDLLMNQLDDLASQHENILKSFQFQQLLDQEEYDQADLLQSTIPESFQLSFTTIEEYENRLKEFSLIFSKEKELNVKEAVKLNRKLLPYLRKIADKRNLLEKLVNEIHSLQNKTT